MRWLRRFLHDEYAATAVEYAVMLAMILMVIIGTLGTVGNQANGLWTRIFNSLQTIVFGH